MFEDLILHMNWHGDDSLGFCGCVAMAGASCEILIKCSTLDLEPPNCSSAYVVAILALDG